MRKNRNPKREEGWRPGATALSLLLSLAVLVLAAAGCQNTSDQTSQTSGSLTEKEAKASLADAAVGHRLAADGSIAADQRGKNFNPGQEVLVAFQTAKAPLGTPVTVAWLGPNDQQLGTDEKTVARGQSYMNFAAKDTSSWAKGEYRADISVAGYKVDSEGFSIVAGDKGDETATNPKSAITEIAMGHELGADGTIAADQEGKKFAPGQPVLVAFKVGGAPAGTKVHIDWIGPNDRKVGAEDRQVMGGEAAMHFLAPNTARWTKGDYHADLSVADEKVDSESFSIVPRGQADRQRQG